jgi:hypothetical protein
MSGIQADFSGAIKKMNNLLCIPKAVKLQATRWASETVRDLKSSSGTMQKSVGPLHKKTSQLARATGMKVGPFPGGFQLGVGTGFGTVNVKYAKIQDEGGTTHPTVTERMRRWAWWAYGVEQGVQRRALKKMLPSMGAKMRRETARMGASKYLGIALTKKAKLDVKVPASKWFTRVIEQREPVLHEYLDPEVVYNIASQMRGGNG